MLKEKNSSLILNLNLLIQKYSTNSKVRKAIVDEFTRRNMKASLAVQILNERIELSTLDVDNNNDLLILFVFTYALYEVIESDEKDRIKLENYFTIVEIENLKNYIAEKKEFESEDVVFTGMIQARPNFWVGTISAKYLAELDAGNEFVYNFKTQRDPVIDIYGMKRINLNKTSVKEIMEGLLSGKQFPTAIVVNVLQDGEDEVIYNERTRELRIISGTKNMVDGQHRKVATVLAIEKNGDLDFNWIIVVTNYSEIRAQEYMVEINKQKPMKTEHIKTLDTSSPGNLVVSAIIDIPTSEFAGKIRDNDAELKHGGLTKKSIIAQAVEECYTDKLSNKLQIRPVAKHIANVVDYIIGLRVNEFIVNPDETKEVSFINHKNMFYGYIALSEILYEDKKWEEKIEEVLDKIDFSKDNSFWNDIGLDNSVINKSTRNNLYKFFKSLI